MSPPTPAVVALDLGTSSVRAVVCDDSAAPIPDALARREVEPWQGEDGSAETDADSYIQAVVSCLDELADAGKLDGVAHVATASQWHSVLAVDPSDPRRRPRTPVLPWLDTRARPHPTRIDDHAFHARTGAWFHSLYWTAKVPFLRERLGGASARYLGLPDYVRAVLLGDDSTSLSLASGAGMLELAAGDWDAEAMELAGTPSDELPAITDTPGRLTGEWRRRWPQLADADWHPVLGDGAASNLGSGCVDTSRVAVTVGTSAALRVVHPPAAPAPAWEVWRYRVDSRREVSGIAMSGGGVLNAWVGDVVGLDTSPEPKTLPGVHGVVSVPFHAGSRPPSTLAPGSGAVFGLSLSTSADELRAATLEGVCLETARALKVLEDSFGTRFDVVLGGGAAHASRWWRQAFAATFARGVWLASDAEVGARGAAAQALGLDVPVAEEVLRPDSEAVDSMRAVRDRYARLRDVVTAVDPDGSRG